MKSFHTASGIHRLRNKSGGKEPKQRALQAKKAYVNGLAAIHKSDVFFGDQLTLVSQYNDELLIMPASTKGREKRDSFLQVSERHEEHLSQHLLLLASRQIRLVVAARSTH